MDCGPPSGVSDPAVVEWAGIFFSNKFPGATAAVGPGSHSENHGSS